MASESNISLEKRLLDLFAHLGIERAHIAARGPNDWSGLVRHHPEAVSSLTLICPSGVTSGSLRNVESRLLILSGDHGPNFDSLPLDNLPDAQVALLPDYETLGWTDVLADRTDEIGSRMIAFLDGPSPSPSQTMDPPGESEGEIAGLTYRVRGSGPPLVLLPLFLAPSQWEPLIPELRERFSTITLGGPLLGPVVVLEARGKTRGYREMLSALFEETALEPGDSVMIGPVVFAVQINGQPKKIEPVRSRLEQPKTAAAPAKAEGPLSEDELMAELTEPMDVLDEMTGDDADDTRLSMGDDDDD